MSNPILNVIIRTSYRPKAFTACIKSILDNFNHDELDVRIIVGYDQEKALYDYIPYRDIRVVSLCDLRRPEEFGPFFYNKYLDLLLQEVTEGHSLFLDDDDTIVKNNIHEVLKDGQSYIVPFLRGENENWKPNKLLMLTKRIIPGYIGLPSLIFWNEHIKYLHFNETEASDYYAINYLSTVVKLSWIGMPIVKSLKRNLGELEKNL